MITLLSPAKTLDFETPLPVQKHTDLLFAEKADYLAKKLAKWKVNDFMKSMDISESLAVLNFERYQTWQMPVSTEHGRAAIFAFKGDVYQGLDAYQMNHNDVEFAQAHIRILSGLYGVLRPLDLIAPYRLEMGTSWTITPKTPGLYAFWRKELTRQLNSDVEASGSRFILNLASQEYAKAVDFKSLGIRVIAPEFKEEKEGRFQMISFFAKKARGLMAAYVIRERINDFDGLHNFSAEGYAFNERLSNLEKDKWVFTRKS